MKIKKLFDTKKKRVLAILVALLLVGTIVGAVVLTNQFRVPTEPVLQELDDDKANVADDDWTARY